MCDIAARCFSKCFDMSLRGGWWKGHWHSVTIPPLLQRVTSPRLHISHMDQWHNSCQGPNVTHVPTILPQTSPSLFTPPCLHPPILSFLSCILSLSTSTPLLRLPGSYFSHPHASVCLHVCVSVCLSYRALWCHPFVSLCPSHPHVSPLCFVPV